MVIGSKRCTEWLWTPLRVQCAYEPFILEGNLISLSISMYTLNTYPTIYYIPKHIFESTLMYLNVNTPY